MFISVFGQSVNIYGTKKGSAIRRVATASGQTPQGGDEGGAETGSSVDVDHREAGTGHLVLGAAVDRAIAHSERPISRLHGAGTSFVGAGDIHVFRHGRSGPAPHRAINDLRSGLALESDTGSLEPLVLTERDGERPGSTIVAAGVDPTRSHGVRVGSELADDGVELVTRPTSVDREPNFVAAVQDPEDATRAVRLSPIRGAGAGGVGFGSAAGSFPTNVTTTSVAGIFIAVAVALHSRVDTSAAGRPFPA